MAYESLAAQGIINPGMAETMNFENMEWDGTNFRVPGSQSYEQSLAGGGIQTSNPLGGWQKFGMGMNALTGLAGILGAYKNYGLMKDQLKFQKALTNRNLANEATLTNKALADKAVMASQMLSGAELGTAAQQAEEERQRTTVDGSPL